MKSFTFLSFSSKLAFNVAVFIGFVAPGFVLNLREIADSTPAAHQKKQAA